MLWYIAFISALNLAVGYALGVALGVPLPFLAGGEPPLPDGPMPPIDPPARRAPPRPVVTSTVAPDPAPSTLAEPAETPVGVSDAVEPASGWLTRNEVEQSITRLIVAGNGADAATVALIEADDAGMAAGIANNAADEETLDRMFYGVMTLVRKLLSDDPYTACYDNRQLLLVLPHADASQATDRVERIRQSVEATQFVRGDGALRASVTCALTETTCGRSLGAVLELLEEALGEAHRHGGNRTFVHDGTTPAPVVPREFGYEVTQCAI